MSVIHLILLAVIVLLGALVLGLLAALSVLSRRKKHPPPASGLVGRLASVETPLAPEGAVMVDGELWRARTRSGACVGSGRLNVRVVGARGHLLEVEPED